MCWVAVARDRELLLAAREALGRRSGVGRPLLLRPFETSFGVAQLLRERLAGRSTLRHLRVGLCLTLRESAGSRRHLGRMPPLRFRERCLRVGQVLRERVAVGDCLSQPDFDLTLALRGVRGGPLFDRGALVRVLPRRLGVGQPEFEHVLGRGSRDELRLAAREALGRRSGVGRPLLLRPFETPFGFAQLLRERLAGRSTLRHLRVGLCLTLRESAGSRRHLGRMPPLRFRERCLRVGQVLREGIAFGLLLVDHCPKEGLALAKELCRGVEALFGFACASERGAHLPLEVLPVGGLRRRRGLQMLSSSVPGLAGRRILTLNAFTVGPCRYELHLERLTLGASSLRKTVRLRLSFVQEPLRLSRRMGRRLCPLHRAADNVRQVGEERLARDVVVCAVLERRDRGSDFLRRDDDYWRGQPEAANLTYKRGAVLVLYLGFNDYGGEILIVVDPAQGDRQVSCPCDRDFRCDLSKSCDRELH